MSGLWTLLDPSLLTGPAAMNGSARGTVLVSLAVAVPTLLTSVVLAARGARPAVLTWMAALLFMVYNAVLLLFMTPFNAAFLCYVALLGTASWGVWALTRNSDLGQFRPHQLTPAVVSGVCVYVWLVAGLNALLWLRQVMPALTSSGSPDFLLGTGTITNAVFVQDLAIWLPLAAIAAWWLLQGQGRGGFVVSSLLGMWVIESLSVAADQWLGHAADPASTVVSDTMVVPFLIFAVVGLVPTVVMLRGARSSPSVPAAS